MEESRENIGPDPGDSRLVARRVHGEKRLAEVFYPAGLRQDRHRHPSATFSFVADGRYAECIGRRSHDRRPSTLIFHPAGEYHAVAFESDVRILSVEFRGPGPTDRVPKCLDQGSSHSSELVGWLGARLGHELARADTTSALAIDGIISELLAEGSRGRTLAAEKSTPAWLARAVEFIHGNFNSNLSLDEIAQIAGVHTAHLSRVFRQKMGCTVGDHVRRLRFEFACQRILSTEESLCEIALDAGFADQSHFNRIFRTRMGTTPFAYRNAHRRSLRNVRFVQDFGPR